MRVGTSTPLVGTYYLPTYFFFRPVCLTVFTPVLSGKFPDEGPTEVRISGIQR